MLRRGRRTAVAALALSVSLAAAACSGDGTDQPAPDPSRPATPSSSPSPSAPGQPVRLDFGVFGEEDEVAAYQAVVDTYNARSDDTEVALRSWPDREAASADLRDGGPVPDVFLASRRDLRWLVEQGLTQPVDELLDERGTDFGDGYSRDALRAFALDARLQCMPYGISPMVVYYNTGLVDFERMRERGLPAPADENDLRWTFEEFAAAADFATRPRLRTRGVHVEPTLRDLAPFVYSGGGELFDDDDEPTRTDFSSDESREALARTLELLRNPQLTLTDEQLDRATPLQWFKRGRLAMVTGFRSLVPELRQVQGLDFDVMSMPSLGTTATIGDITGLCLSADAASTPEAADFLVAATSVESVTRVTRAGYLAPANLAVALSDDFLQEGRLPRSSTVFVDAVRSLRLPPLVEDWDALDAAVGDGLRSLVTSAPELDLEAVTEQVDEASRTVLDPESLESEDAEPEDAEGSDGSEE